MTVLAAPALRAWSAAMTGIALVGIIIMATPASAALPDASLVSIADSGDTAWLLATTLIALLTVIPGIILTLIGARGWAAGPPIITASLAGVALATLLFILIGYSLMFDVTSVLSFGAFLGGGAHWMLNAMGTLRDGMTVPETAFVLFQLSAVLIAVTLLNAILAGKARGGWQLAFSGLWVLLVLVPVTRWMWGGGWLADTGAIDGGGGLVLFFCAAISGITALALTGRGKPPSTELGDDFTRLIGAFLLFVGLVAVAGGGAAGATDNSGVAMLTITTAGMVGALTSAALRRRVDAGSLAGGLIAGSVGAAAAGDGVSIGAAWIIGVVCAMAFHWGPRLVPARLARHDSGRTASGIAAAAMTGALLFAIFLAFTPFGGSGYAEGMTMTGQAVAQITAILAIAGWSIFGTLVAALMAGLALPMHYADAADE